MTRDERRRPQTFRISVVCKGPLRLDLERVKAAVRGALMEQDQRVDMIRIHDHYELLGGEWKETEP